MNVLRWSSRRVNVVGIAAVAAFGVVIFAIGWDGSGASPPGRGNAGPVAVESDARHRFDDLDDLVAGADLVISGRVVGVEPGRTFGGVDAGGEAAGAIRSQVVTLEIAAALGRTDALRAPDPGTVVLVEEEAALADGTPIAVDGARPTGSGDEGIWFLVASTDPEFPGFVVVNSQGRYLVADEGVLLGADRTDGLVRRLESLGRDGLATAVAAVRTDVEPRG